MKKEDKALIIDKYKDVTLLTLLEDFTILNNVKIRKEINTYIKENNVNRLIFDLSELKMISSPTLGTIVEISQQLNRKNGKLAIVAPSENIKNLFTMANLELVININNTIFEAYENVKS